MLKRFLNKSMSFVLVLTFVVSVLTFNGIFTLNASDSYQKFITFNLRYDVTSHEAMGTGVRGPHLLEAIQKYGADSIGFQEATDTWMNYLRVEMDKIGYSYVGVGRDRGDDDPTRVSNGNEHEPVFYLRDKYNLIDSDSIWLHPTPDKISSTAWGASNTRLCTYAVLEDRVTGEIYIHFNTHLDHISMLAQENGTRLIMSRMKSVVAEYGDVGYVVTGDFNAVRFDNTNPNYIPTTYNVATAHLDDSRDLAETKIVDGGTFNGFQNPIDWENGLPSGKDKPPVDTDSSPIDYIFLAKGMYDVKTYTVIDDTYTFVYNGTQYTNHPISDHYGVFSEAKLKDNPVPGDIDESKLIDIPAKTYVGGSDLSSAVLGKIIDVISYGNIAPATSVSSSVACAESNHIANVLDRSNSTAKALVSNYSGNLFWEISLNFKGVADVYGLSYKVASDNIPAYTEVLGSTDGTTWKKIGSSIVSKPTANSDTYIILDAPEKFKSIKLLMADTANGTEISNISVFGNQTVTEAIGANEVTPISGSKAGQSEGYEKLFDDKLSTKFYVRDEEAPTAVWKLASPQKTLYYSFTTANDNAGYPGRTPKAWTLYGSTSGLDGSWTVIDQEKDYAFSDVNYREFLFEIDNPGVYEYYKIIFTEFNLVDNRIQFSALTLYREGAKYTQIPQYELTPISGPNPGAREGYEKLFDGDTSTKCYISNITNPTIIWSLDKPEALHYYTLISANDHTSYSGRYPRGWSLYGSATGQGDSWEIIDTVADYSFPNINYTRFSFYISNPAPYQYYKIVFSGYASSNNNMQLSELEIYKSAVTENMADYTAIQSAIRSIPNNLSGYTPESVKVLLDSLIAVDYSLQINNQAEVDVMAKAIIDAINGLK